VVTGATSTLSRALLRRLWADPAWAGVRFYLVGRDRVTLQALCAQASLHDRSAIPWVLDLAGAAAAESVKTTLASLPPLKGFVLAAGLAQDQILPLMDEAGYERVWQVNCGVHALMLKSWAKTDRLAAGARGLLICSLSGLGGRQGQTAYGAAKGALLDLLPFAPPGLRLNILLPPLMPSPFLDALGPGVRSALMASRLMDDPDPAQSCADAAHFFLSDAASYVHRQILHADSRVTALGWE